MTTINVTFVGICTHLWAKEEQRNTLPNPAWGTRIVLPNASSQTVIDNINTFYGLDDSSRTKMKIKPHFAGLFIFENEFVSIEGPGTLSANGFGMLRLALNGVTVTVPANLLAELTKNARCMPGLGSFVSDLAPGAATFLEDASLASCYFDFTTGAVTGTTLAANNNAGSIVYSANTQENPVPVTLTPFGGGEPTVIKVRPNTDDSVNVVIANITEFKEDNDNDFVLHYLVAGSFPASVPSLGRIGCPVNLNGQAILDGLGLGGPEQEIGVGCSNSNIP